MTSKEKEALERMWEACMLDITCQSDYETLKQALERLEELKQIWGKEEWCQGIPLSADSLKSLFNYNEELFNKNLELDKKKLELEKENQELKEQLQLTETARQLIYNELKCCSGMGEYIQKLKKAIEIIVNKMVVVDLLQSIFRGVDFYFFNANKEKMLETYNSQYYIQEPYRLTEKEFELLYEMLREVLE